MNLGKGLNTTELFDGLRAAVRRARLSVVETVFLIAAVFFAVLVMFFYLTKIQPRESQLRSLRQRISTAQVTLAKLGRQAEDRREQQKNAETILSSLQDFEARLKEPQRGRTQIIDEINHLTKENHVVPGDISYVVTAAAETTDEKGNPIQPAARSDKNVSIYPALGISTTVDGDYHNLRRFISDLERSQQFVIINALALQSVELNSRRGGKRGGPIVGPAGPVGPGVQPQVPALAAAGQDSLTVALKIEMDTYFQKRTTP